MKKLIILLVFIFLAGCEKDVCLECTTTITIPDHGSISKTEIICDHFTRKEILRYKKTIWPETGPEGTTAITYCTEVK